MNELISPHFGFSLSGLSVFVGDCVSWGDNELNGIVIKKLTKKHHGITIGFALGDIEDLK